MSEIRLNFENCYGIKKMNQKLKFADNNISVIYASNGTMKTSFANVFRDLSEGKMPCDRVYNLPTICEVLNENDIQINPENILVISPFDEQITAEQGKLMADASLQRRYMDIHKSLADAKKKLMSDIKILLKYGPRTKFEPEQELSNDFKSSIKDIYKTLTTIRDTIASGISNNFKMNDIEHSILFDSKALDFYKKESNAQLIKRYAEKYDELMEKSKFLQKGVFDHRNFVNVAKNLKENGYFAAKHQVVINYKEEGIILPPIDDEEQLNKLLEEEKEKILNDTEIKKIFEKISAEITANKATKDLDQYLLKNSELIIELEDIDAFKKKVWYEAFKENINNLDTLIKIYDESMEALNKISKEAEEQQTKWSGVLTVFKERFFVPFKIEPSNQEDVILKNALPAFRYIFEQTGNGLHGIEKDQLLDVLSTGERRAYYLLDLIYKVEIKAEGNIETVLILDDIADSFDYKNKYAIIEYLKDIRDRVGSNGKKLFKIIVLTHNFDFYRTVGSRIAKGKNCYIAAETETGIELTAGQYIKNYFNYIKGKCLAGEIQFILTAIPFVRNLIEYTYLDTDPEYSDYINLTNILHMKPVSKTLLLSDIQTIFNKYWLNNAATFAIGNTDKVFDLIEAEANRIIADPVLYNQINVENKIVLSMGIRLKAEELMINQITQYVPNGADIISRIMQETNQTGALFDEYVKNLDCFPISHKRNLEKVVMMTPENIHINSFMYEPILDMHGLHLVKLYKDITA